MEYISAHWLFYREWVTNHYLAWSAQIGLIAAFTLAFTLVLR